MVKLHFSRLAPSAERNTLLSILPIEHKLTKKESMKEHRDFYGNIDDWGYHFIVYVINDKTVQELDYLLDTDEDSGFVGQKYIFDEPLTGSDHYNEIYNFGQVELSFSEFNQYIRER